MNKYKSIYIKRKRIICVTQECFITQGNSFSCHEMLFLWAFRGQYYIVYIIHINVEKMYFHNEKVYI